MKSWPAWIHAIVLIAAITQLVGCGNRRKSDRELRRDQIRVNAEAKRRELQNVKGRYYGYLEDAKERQLNVTLSLEIKDLPQDEEGEIDPVMVPSLTGFLRLNYDSNESQYISFS